MQTSFSKSGALLLTFAPALLAVATFAGCASRPVEETVSTDASRSSALPAGAEPIAIAATLPERDADIEAAGDRIGEAITYLRVRRRDAALRALNEAEMAINHALRGRGRNDAARAALRAILKDLDTVERTIVRGGTDAPRQLAALNRSLDNVDLRPAAPEPATGSESPSPRPSPTSHSR